MKSTKELLDILTLNSIDSSNFEGFSENVGSPIVFGGQVLAQAVHAAHRTIPKDRVLHSLHSYFLEPGNLSLPILYNVQNLRDGGSFSTRRVTALQQDKPIFILAASFHKKENGLEYQSVLTTDIKQPEELFSWDDILMQMGDFLPQGIKAFLEIQRPIDFKPVEIPNPLERKNLPPISNVWFKPKGLITDLSLAKKQEILTYISDYNLLTTCLNPHASSAHFGNMKLASLDHSMWFHQDFNFDDWMLFSVEAINTFGGRGLAKANVYMRGGQHVATVLQEGLMRKM